MSPSEAPGQEEIKEDTKYVQGQQDILLLKNGEMQGQKVENVLERKCG